MSANNNTSIEIDKDPVLSVFASKSFDGKRYLQQKLQQQDQKSFQDEISQLNNGITLLNSEIAQQVQQNQNELIQQVVKFNKLENELIQVRQDVAQLQSSVQRYFPLLF